MRTQDLMRAIGLLDEELVVEAEQPERLRAIRWRRWAALAACAALLLALPWLRVLPWLSGSGGTAQDSLQAEAGQMDAAAAEQAQLEPFAAKFASGGFGFEGLFAYDPQELGSAGPWQEGEETPAALPVYRNENELLADGAACFGLDAEQMEQQLRALAAALGYEVETVEISPSAEEAAAYRQKLEQQGRDPDTDPNYEINTRPYSARAAAEGAELELLTTGEFTVRLTEPLVLPQEYRLTQQSTLADAERTSLYLAGLYAEQLGIADPQPQARVDYSYEGEKKLTLAVRSGGALERQLLEFGFGGLQFYLDETGGACRMLRLWGTQAAGESMGDYPLISAEEAAALLEEGRCYTSVSEPFPGIEYLARTELVYREGTQAVAPYYRFWVELPSLEKENGLRTFGAYYVPAVRAEYLIDPPLSQWAMGE